MPPRHNVTEHQCVVWKSWFLLHGFLDPCHMLSERWTLLFLCVPLAENVNKITILVSIAFRNLFPGHNPKQFQQFLWKKIPSYHKDMQFGHGRSSRSVSKVKVNASLSLHNDSMSPSFSLEQADDFFGVIFHGGVCATLCSETRTAHHLSNDHAKQK